MPTLYKVPLEIDPNTMPAFVVAEAIERHDVNIDYPEGVDYVEVTGAMETLVEFFHYLDGSAQSFPVDEFREWAKSYEVDENGIPV